MDSFTTSQSILHTVFSLVLPLMSAMQASGDSVSPFHLEGKTSGLNRAATGHLLVVGGHVGALTIEEQREQEYWPFKEIKQ